MFTGNWNRSISHYDGWEIEGVRTVTEYGIWGKLCKRTKQEESNRVMGASGKFGRVEGMAKG